MEQLKQLSENPLVLAGLLVGVVLLIFLFRMVRRQNGAAAPESLEESAWKTLCDYGEIYPSFLFILKAFRKENGLTQLVQRPAVAEAVERLEAFHAAPKSGSANSSHLTLLIPLPAARSSQVQGALLTILREIYSAPEWTASLSEQAHEEVDRMLDSLAG